MNLRAYTLTLSMAVLCVMNLWSQTKTANDSLIKAFFNDTVNEGISRNDIAQSTENAFTLMNGAQTEAVLSWQVLEAQKRLVENREILRVLRKELNSHTNAGFRNIQLYGNMLEDIQANNKKIRELFDETEKKLENNKRKIKAITQDSIIRYMIVKNAADTSKNKKRNRSKRLKNEYLYTSQLIKTSLDSVHRWSSMLSFQSITTIDLLQKKDSILKQNSVQALNGDCRFLWKAQMKAGVVDTSSNEFTAGGNSQIIGYYSKKNLLSILWIPLFVFLFFLRWTWKNFKLVHTFSNPELQNEEQLRFIKGSRILLSLIIGFSLFPLLDVHAPWLYLLISQCIVMGSVTFYFFKKETRGILPAWLMLFALLIGISITSSFEPDLLQRISLIALNGASIFAGILLFKKVKHTPQIHRTIKVITILYIIINALAVICNIFGRVIISEALTNAGIIGITQIITLSVFIQAIIEVLYLQLLASRIKRGIDPGFDHGPVIKSILKPLFLFALLIWGIMFSANLYMFEMLRKAIGKGLSSDLSIGSISFTVGNMVLFFFIIWIAHLLQTYIGSFFGDGENDEDLESKKQRSRMMVVKLVVICVGYLLAVAVSGLPLDKITIILGALGVGVGMGLQNIVNNFVSGVVLIFDRPLQIGDSIEVKENKGKVKSIGIRSSTLLTQDGAEVIIPNGDILSNPITNWTLSNNARRLELEFTLQSSESKETIIDLIKATLASAEDVSEEREPTVTVENIKDEEISLRVYFWCENGNKSEWIKSEVRYQLYGVFHKHNILVK